jgi:hypothetical protein
MVTARNPADPEAPESQRPATPEDPAERDHDPMTVSGFAPIVSSISAFTPTPNTSLPADPTAPVSEEGLPPDAGPISGMVSVTRKPLLASEALMNELAPVEPLRREARAWAAGVGAASLVIGALPVVGLLPGGMPAAVPWFVTGAISLVAAITPVSYRQRAVAMVVLGLLSGVVALQGANGALTVGDGGMFWGVTRLLGAVALPAALLFRARYRAYRGARIALGAAICLSLPFAIHTALGLLAPVGLATAGEVAVLFVLAGSFAGFMSAETTAAGAYMAPTAVVVLALDVALRGMRHGPLLGVVSDAAALIGASALASLGLFQILAWRFAADARRIDLHPPPRESRPPTSERDAASDWSTRE